MKTARQLKVLHQFYTIFNAWGDQPVTACTAGCSTCCSRNVTITALEGVEILRWVVSRGRSPWLARVLANSEPVPTPRLTTNEFAAACLAGREVGEQEEADLSPCPLLERGYCQIYPVRPLACRLFISNRSCQTGQAAQLPEYYLSAATILNQLTEHLGQGEYWGNMLDVLPALLDIREFAEIAAGIDPLKPIQARLRTRRAIPIPGFLFLEREEKTVGGLLTALLDGEVDGQRIADILNGR